MMSLLLLFACGPTPRPSFDSDPEEINLGVLEVGESAEAWYTLTNNSDGYAYNAGCQFYASSIRGEPIVSFIDGGYFGEVWPGSVREVGLQITIPEVHPGDGWVHVLVYAKKSLESAIRSDVGEFFLTWEAPDTEDTGEAEDTGDTGDTGGG